MEKQELGSWADVGYTGPGTNDNSSSTHTNVMNYFEADDNVWTAQPVKPLNDCTDQMSWTLTPTASGTNVQYEAEGSDNCVALTPSWDNLSRATN